VTPTIGTFLSAPRWVSAPYGSRSSLPAQLSPVFRAAGVASGIKGDVGKPDFPALFACTPRSVNSGRSR